MEYIRCTETECEWSVMYFEFLRLLWEKHDKMSLQKFPVSWSFKKLVSASVVKKGILKRFFVMCKISVKNLRNFLLQPQVHKKLGFHLLVFLQIWYVKVSLRSVNYSSKIRLLYLFIFNYLLWNFDARKFLFLLVLALVVIHIQT